MNLYDILKVVEDVSGVDPSKKTRKTAYVQARQAYYYLSFIFLNYPYQAMADVFNQDHVTAMHSIKVCSNAMRTTPSALSNLIIECKRRISEIEKDDEPEYYSIDMINYVLKEIKANRKLFNQLIRDEKIQKVFNNDYGTMQRSPRSDAYGKRDEKK